MSARKITKLIILLGILTTGISACRSYTADVESRHEKMPEWIYHYEAGNRTCGVGISLPHIKGVAYQRAVAVARGIDEIARQKNVRVDTTLEHYMKVSDGNLSSSGLSSFSVQTTSGVSISARIVDAWMNSRTDELYVLLCTD